MSVFRFGGSDGESGDDEVDDLEIGPVESRVYIDIETRIGSVKYPGTAAVRKL